MFGHSVLFGRPILHRLANARDRSLVGRIEPRIDRPSATLRVLGLWWEAWFDPMAEPGFADAFGTALEAHARFLDADRLTLPRTARQRELMAAVRARLTPGRRFRG